MFLIAVWHEKTVIQPKVGLEIINSSLIVYSQVNGNRIVALADALVRLIIF